MFIFLLLYLLSLTLSIIGFILLPASGAILSGFCAFYIFFNTSILLASICIARSMANHTLATQFSPPYDNEEILANNGTVTLSGNAQLTGEPLKAPISQRPCCWYRLTIAKRNTGTLFDYQPLFEYHSQSPFCITNPTQSVLIDPRPPTSNTQGSLSGISSSEDLATDLLDSIPDTIKQRSSALLEQLNANLNESTVDTTENTSEDGTKTVTKTYHTQDSDSTITTSRSADGTTRVKQSTLSFKTNSPSSASNNATSKTELFKDTAEMNDYLEGIFSQFGDSHASDSINISSSKETQQTKNHSLKSKRYLIDSTWVRQFQDYIIKEEIIKPDTIIQYHGYIEKTPHHKHPKHISDSAEHAQLLKKLQNTASAGQSKLQPLVSHVCNTLTRKRNALGFDEPPGSSVLNTSSIQFVGKNTNNNQHFFSNRKQSVFGLSARARSYIELIASFTFSLSAMLAIYSFKSFINHDFAFWRNHYPTHVSTAKKRTYYYEVKDPSDRNTYLTLNHHTNFPGKNNNVSTRDYGNSSTRDYENSSTRYYENSSARDYGNSSTHDYGNSSTRDYGSSTARDYGNASARDYDTY